MDNRRSKSGAMSRQGFLSRVKQQHLRRKERPFCFILGAGASKSSNMPTGYEMALEWLKELHQEDPQGGSDMEDWARKNAPSWGLDDFELAKVASYYPQLYKARFDGSPESGYACLEEKLTGKEPSIGYSHLANILANTHHRIVVTTNFDNLVADALYAHSKAIPLVVGHDALASYVKAELRRPLIAKVHGDIGLAMRNSPAELASLPTSWHESLREVIRKCTPIVIGYDGNDGSLMGLLEGMKPKEWDGLFWCFHDPQDNHVANLAKVPRKVRDLVSKAKGHMVPIQGFDEIMFLLQDAILGDDSTHILQQLQERHERRMDNYRQQLDAIREKTAKPSPAEATGRPVDAAKPDPALAKVLAQIKAPSSGEKSWIQWALEIRAETDPDRKEQIIRQSLEAFPQSPDLLGEYAMFLLKVRKNEDGADHYFRQAMQANPTHATNLGNYAGFLERFRRDMETAEKMYLKAIEVEPSNPNNLGNYAWFLHNEKRDMDRANEYYFRSVQADPASARNLCSYAWFLQTAKQNYPEAEKIYRKAIEADPKYPNGFTSYATFLHLISNNLDAAERYYRKAIDVDPNNPNSHGNMAHFYFAQGRRDEAFEYLNRAEAMSPTYEPLLLELAFYRLAHDRAAWPGRLGKVRDLLQRGARSLGWPLALHVDIAERNGHPNPALLRAIAGVITKDEPLAGLVSFPEWPAAPAT